MPDDGWAELRAQIGGTVPAGLRRLTGAQRRDLAAAVKEARHRQAAALAQAGERSLDHIPRLLRGAVRRVVG